MNRREELKAQINEKLDQLSVEDLEKVAGGVIIGPIGKNFVCPFCGTKLSPFDTTHVCTGFSDISDPDLENAK